MSALYVWVLVIYMGGTGQGGPTIIDNISTAEECDRVAKVIYQSGAYPFYKGLRCIQVQKVKP